MQRRKFVQLTSGFFASLSLSNPFKAVADKLSVKKAIGKKKSPPDFRPSFKYVCYVYNPGIDIVGVNHLTFNQRNVIKGGQISEIKSGVRWCHPNWLAEGVAELERLIVDSQRNKIDRHTGYRYSAHELTQNLVDECEQSHTPLLWIREWDNTTVDIKVINAVISSGTLDGRLANIKKLPTRVNKFKVAARKSLIEYKEFAETEITERIDRIKSCRMNCEDGYTRNLIALLGHSVNLRELIRARAAMEDEMIARRLINDMIVQRRLARPKERSIAKAKKAIAERVKAFLEKGV